MSDTHYIVTTVLLSLHRTDISLYRGEILVMWFIVVFGINQLRYQRENRIMSENKNKYLYKVSRIHVLIAAEKNMIPTHM